jgi:hypothetical protein
LVNTSRKFDQAKGWGHRSDVSACCRVISAVRRMNTKGVRNTTQRTMARAWFPNDGEEPAAAPPVAAPAGVERGAGRDPGNGGGGYRMPPW